jgi:hypothetical protein
VHRVRLLRIQLPQVSEWEAPGRAAPTCDHHWVLLCGRVCAVLCGRIICCCGLFVCVCYTAPWILPRSTGSAAAGVGAAHPHTPQPSPLPCHHSLSPLRLLCPNLLRSSFPLPPIQTHSRDITLTPRQRIATYKEINRLRRIEAPTAAEKARLATFEGSYTYDGDATCAADGMCQEKCPVKINTGGGGELGRALEGEGFLRARWGGGPGCRWCEDIWCGTKCVWEGGGGGQRAGRSLV